MIVVSTSVKDKGVSTKKIVAGSVTYKEVESYHRTKGIKIHVKKEILSSKTQVNTSFLLVTRSPRQQETGTLAWVVPLTADLPIAHQPGLIFRLLDKG